MLFEILHRRRISPVDLDELLEHCVGILREKEFVAFLHDRLAFIRGTACTKSFTASTR